MLVSVSGQPHKKIGQTPVNLVEQTLGAGQESFQIIVTKDGYVSESVLIPPTTLERATTIRVNLKEMAAGNKAINEQTLQRVASTVALAQNLIKSKQYDQAEQSLSGLITQYPGVPTFHELLGNVYYLKKDLSKALVSYKKAAELDPSNVDTQRMIMKIDPRTRLPAGGR